MGSGENQQGAAGRAHGESERSRNARRQGAKRSPGDQASARAWTRLVWGQGAREAARAVGIYRAARPCPLAWIKLEAGAVRRGRARAGFWGPLALTVVPKRGVQVVCSGRGLLER
jgi:hypothetical protein